jgi:Flp pilus assembly pilin Flp
MRNRIKSLVKRLHRDERGAEGLEKLLIIAAIIIPLLGVLWYAKKWVTDYVQVNAQKVQDAQGYDQVSDNGWPSS